MKPLFETVVTFCVSVPKATPWTAHMQCSEWNTQLDSKEN